MTTLVPFLAPTACLLAGVLIGLLAGAKWRRVLRQERNEARALVVMFNSSAVADDRAEVGPVTPPRGSVELFDQDALNEMRSQLNQAERIDPVDVPTPNDDQHHPCPACDGSLVTLDDGSRWCTRCTKFWDPPDIDAPDHLGQACDFPLAEAGGPCCNRPAEGWVRWDNGHVEWLCARHYTLVMGSEHNQKVSD